MNGISIWIRLVPPSPTYGVSVLLPKVFVLENTTCVFCCFFHGRIGRHSKMFCVFTYIGKQQMDAERNSMQEQSSIFVLNSHLDLIGDQNDAQYLSIHCAYLAYLVLYLPTLLCTYLPVVLPYVPAQ